MKSTTPRTDQFDRIEHPKGDYPLMGPQWVPIDDCRELENELFLSRAAHDIAECELAQARAQVAELAAALETVCAANTSYQSACIAHNLIETAVADEQMRSAFATARAALAKGQA